MRSITATAPGLPRTPFNSPALVRLLAQWATPHGHAATPAADAAGSVAERLGQWLDWTDAIALSAALNHGADTPQPGPKAATAAASAASASAALARVQAAQARAITSDAVFQLGADSDGTVDFAPYRRACQARQRAMQAAIGPLRAQLRTALAATSATLARLAALDATLDTALGERERHLLGGVVGRLEQHFLQLRQAAAPGWLGQAHQAMQQALLAELDLRLQPALGLLDALAEARGPAG